MCQKAFLRHLSWHCLEKIQLIFNKNVKVAIDLFVKIRSKDNKEILRVVPVHIGECDEILSELEENKGHNVNGSFNFFSFKNNKSLENYIGNGEIM